MNGMAAKALAAVFTIHATSGMPGHDRHDSLKPDAVSPACLLLLHDDVQVWPPCYR